MTLTVEAQKELQNVLWARRCAVVWEKLWFLVVVVRNQVLLNEIDAEGWDQDVAWCSQRLLWCEDIFVAYSGYYAETDGGDNQVGSTSIMLNGVF